MSNCICATTRPKSGTKRPNTPASFIQRRTVSGRLRAVRTSRKKAFFDKETATKFRDNILSKGGTEHPMLLYKRFRGQEPKPDALLKRAGLLV